MKTIFFLLLIGMFSKVILAEHAPFAHFTPSVNSFIDFGKGRYLDCINSLDEGNKMTITLWVRWSNKGAAGVGNWANLFTLADSIVNGDNGVFWVQHNSDNTKFEFALHTNTRTYIQSTTNPQNNHWYFLALVYDGSLPNQNMKLYVDGVLESTSNKTGNIRTFPGASRLNMGRWPYSGNNYRHFNGSIDEVSIWNIALSPAQIANLKDDPESVTGTTYSATGLMGYWNFDDLTANDLGTCSNDGLVGSGTSLPVTLTSFFAKQVNSTIDLCWSTSSEINNSHFVLERSANGVEFQNIGSVEGAGNSNRILSYMFSDNEPLIGVSYYRLTQVDKDGKKNVYKIIDVTYAKVDDINIKLFPNPSNGENIKIYSDSFAGSFDVVIYDISGREVYRKSTSTGQLEIPSDSFCNGVFIVKYNSVHCFRSIRLVKS